MKKDFLYAFVSNIIYTFFQYLILAALTKSYPKEIVGDYLFAFVLVNPITTAMDMQLRSFYVSETGRFAYDDYKLTRMVSNGISVFLGILVCLLYRPDLFIIVLGVLLFKNIYNNTDLMYGVLQKNKRFDLICLVRVVTAIVMFLGVIFFAWKQAPLWCIIFSQVVASALSVVYISYLIRAYSILPQRRLVLNFGNVRAIFAMLSTIIALQLVNIFMLSFPQYIIEANPNMGRKMVAIVGTLSYMKMLTSFMINSIGQVAAPKLAGALRLNNYKYFHRLTIKLVGMGLLLGVFGTIVAWLFGEELITLFFNKDYAEYNNIFIIIMAGTIFSFGHSCFGVSINCLRIHHCKLFIHTFVFLILLGVLYFTEISASVSSIMLLFAVGELMTFFCYALSYLFYVNFVLPKRVLQQL